MDREIQALNNQSLIDIAIQTTGSVEGVFELALKNGLSITDDLKIGQILQVVPAVKEHIKDYYETNNLKPATAIMRIFDNTFDLTFN